MARASWILPLVCIGIMAFSYPALSNDSSSLEHRNDAKQNTNLAVMQDAARQTNLQLPKMLDDKTRLDRLIVLDTKNVKYQVTIISSDKKDIDIEKFISIMKPHLNKIYRTNPQFKIFRDNGIGVLYEYYDKNGILFAAIHAEE